METQAHRSALAARPRKAAMGMLAVAVFLPGCGGDDTAAPGAGPTIATASSVVAAPGAVSAAAPTARANPISGWASQGEGTTGGAGAPASNIYLVRNWAELKAALANVNSPTHATNPAAARVEPKIIRISGTIYGTDIGNGRLADEAYYKSRNATAAKWDWSLYLQSLDTVFMADLNARAAAGDAAAIATKTRISALSSAKGTLRNIQKEQIQAIVPSNTTIVGAGTDAKLVDGYFSINASKNIIIRNLELEAPRDLTADWNGKEWNARYKAISVVTGRQLWFDHLTLSDGSYPDSAEVVTINGVTSRVQRHDGLIDMEDSTDYVTLSYNIFKNHDKTNMVGGSGDQNGAKERAFNRLTFSNNIWENTTQRAPRARFGRIHLYNNYYKGDTAAREYKLSYWIGMGAESKILSEANAFEIAGPNANASKVVSNLNGYQFKDVGSWINGVPASGEIEAAARAALEKNWTSASAAALASNFTIAPYTNELGWVPAYGYTPAASFDELKAHNLALAGAGKVSFDPAALDVTAGFSLLRSGLVLNRITGKHTATIRLTNTSGAQLSGPFQLVFNNLSAGVTLEHASGTRGGAPYITLSGNGNGTGTGNAIAPGTSVTVALTYSNPGRVAIAYTNSVFSGNF